MDLRARIRGEQLAGMEEEPLGLQSGQSRRVSDRSGACNLR